MSYRRDLEQPVAEFVEEHQSQLKKSAGEQWESGWLIAALLSWEEKNK